MFRRKLRKYTVWMLSAALVLTAPFTVLADQEEESGYTIKEEDSSAPVEDIRQRPEIFQVILPANVENVFDFIMDPQELIEKTDAEAYDGSYFEEDATLFFKRSDDEADEDYSSLSDALTIINKGTVDVEVRLTASISPDSIDGITLSDNPEFTGDTEASLYLALTDGENTVPISSEEGAVIETTVYGISEDDEYNEYSFQLTGAVNKEGNWSELTDISPKVIVTWEVDLGDDDLDEEEDSDIVTNDATEENKIANGDGEAAKEATVEENGEVAGAEAIGESDAVADAEAGNQDGIPSDAVDGENSSNAEASGENGTEVGTEESLEGDTASGETAAGEEIPGESSGAAEQETANGIVDNGTAEENNVTENKVPAEDNGEVSESNASGEHDSAEDNGTAGANTPSEDSGASGADDATGENNGSEKNEPAKENNTSGEHNTTEDSNTSGGHDSAGSSDQDHSSSTSGDGASSGDSNSSESGSDSSNESSKNENHTTQENHASGGNDTSKESSGEKNDNAGKDSGSSGSGDTSGNSEHSSSQEEKGNE